MKKLRASLPSYIYLLGKEIKVYEQADAIMHEGEELDGYYEHEASKILVQHRLSPDSKFRVFCHECAHSYLTQLGIDQCLPKWAVECICQVVSMIVCDIIKGTAGVKK